MDHIILLRAFTPYQALPWTGRGYPIKGATNSSTNKGQEHIPLSIPNITLGTQI